MTLARAKMNTHADMIAVAIAQLAEIEQWLRDPARVDDDMADCDDSYSGSESDLTIDGLTLTITITE